MKKIRVVVVDDSALVRGLIAEIINRQVDMECVGVASDPIAAREMIRNLNPDVITLDVEMPRMDGIEFLRRLMRLRPIPVVMISTLTDRGAEVTVSALELGAVDFVLKPRIGVASGLSKLSSEIVEKLRIAASSCPKRSGTPVGKLVISESEIKVLGALSTKKVVFIGASTGGTEAIKEILTKLPSVFPPIVIVQHMPPGFTASFAARLNGLCQITVQEAMDGERLLPGNAYIAPGGKQFRLDRSGLNYVAVVEEGVLVNRHKPSVDVLFQSGAKIVGSNALAILLTGMGNDGAKAMRGMKDAGSYNFVQNEASSVVFGMPREAIALGAAHEVLAVADIAAALVTKLCRSSVLR